MIVGLAATGCTTAPKTTGSIHTTKRLQTGAPGKVTYNYTTEDRSCLKRAMYFESQHSDHDGYMAVGSVVMNRLTSPAYPKSICGVVSQARQFAPGVMTREVKVQAEPDLDAAADALLKGERNNDVKEAMFFHTDGLKFPYDNMHYVAVAGGNAFYEKRGADGELQTPSPLPAYEVAMNYVPAHSNMAAQFELLAPPAAPAPTQMPMVEGVVNTAYEEPETVPAPMPAPQIVAQRAAAPQAMAFSAPAKQAQATIETVAFTIPTAVAVPMPRPSTFDNARMRGNPPFGG